MQFRRVFDQKFINGLPPIDKFSNHIVVNLCRRNDPSSEAFRTQIERWFHNLPEEHKADIYSRLRKLDDRQHLPAFYELFFHQYCWENRWKVQKHPLIGGKKPEFLIELPNQISFFLEVATVIENEKLRKKKARYYKLLRKINAIKTNFWVSVLLNRWPAENINYNAITKKIEKWLKILVEKKRASYQIEIDELGFNGEINADYYPGSKPRSGCVYAWLYPLQVGDPTIAQVKSAISSKVKKYKAIKISGSPFVIAICSGYYLDEMTMDNVLYGNQLISCKIGAPRNEVKLHRNYSGLITPKPGFLGQPRNTGISAVIFCSRIWRDERMLYKMRIFHNPWAVTKLPFEVYEDLPQLYEVKKNPKKITLEWFNDNKQEVVMK